MYAQVCLVVATMMAFLTPACGRSDVSTDAGRRTVDSCFASGTRIATPAGEVPIESLRVGQQVFAYDHATGLVAVSAVTRTWTHRDSSYRMLHASEQDTVGVTSGHPVYRANTRSYVPAGELTRGDRIMRLDGESRVGLSVTATVLSAPLADKLRRGTVHNISVAHYANYFANGILVHNKSYRTDAPDRRVEITRTGPDLGDVPVGCAALTTFTVTYNGTGVSSPLSVALSGPASADYELADDQCDAVSLPSGSTCDIQLRFTPSAAGARRANLVASTSGTGSGSAYLEAVGVASSGLTISPPRLEFANSTVGGAPDQFTFTITNGSKDQYDGVSAAIAGDDFGDFAIVNDGCLAPVPGHCDRCAVTAEFNPLSSGNKDAILTIATSPIGGGVEARLFGLASLADATLELEPAVNDFGTIRVGDNSTQEVIFVTNVGAEATGPVSVTLSGPNAGDFSLPAGECVPPSDGLEGGIGARCLVFVQFDPLAPGTRTATLTATATPGGTVTSALVGTGLAAAAAKAP